MRKVPQRGILSISEKGQRLSAARGYGKREGDQHALIKRGGPQATGPTAKKMQATREEESDN